MKESHHNRVICEVSVGSMAGEVLSRRVTAEGVEPVYTNPRVEEYGTQTIGKGSGRPGTVPSSLVMAAYDYNDHHHQALQPCHTVHTKQRAAGTCRWASSLYNSSPCHVKHHVPQNLEVSRPVNDRLSRQVSTMSSLNVDKVFSNQL
ncbi:hypothetical protein E2C01_033273 [Portunus trituberculatus]|uniref:Uncharacterized protein n=1 Tax=Portunus trituberculatus TaxID=210409 RepID=A0A5B7F303_PORTR|nr:hypothetical protein [Portunus trituberculatus]